MNTKKAITIGLLSIAAISLVGCAIVFAKKNPNYKPKTTEVAASNTINDIQFTAGTYEIKEVTITLNNESDSQTNFSATFKYNPLTETLTTTNFSTNKIDGRSLRNNYTNTTEYTITNAYEQPVQYVYYTLVSYEVTRTGTLPNYIYMINPTFAISLETEDYTNEITFTPQVRLRLNSDAPTGTTTPNKTLYSLGIQYQIEYLQEEFNYIYATGVNSAGDYAPIDIRGLMLNVLTMPFTFLNKAFDVTLWPNTQYAFNIGNFIKGVIAIAAILFIIRLFTSGFSIIGNYTGSKADSRLARQERKARIAKTKAETAKISRKE